MDIDGLRDVLQKLAAEALQAIAVSQTLYGLRTHRIWPASAMLARRAARLVTGPLAVNVQRVPRSPSKRVEPTNATQS